MASGTGDNRPELVRQGVCNAVQGTGHENSSGSPKMITSSSTRIRPVLVACAALSAALLLVPRVCQRRRTRRRRAWRWFRRQSRRRPLRRRRKSQRRLSLLEPWRRRVPRQRVPRRRHSHGGGWHGGGHYYGGHYYHGGWGYPYWGWGWGWPYYSSWGWGGPSVYVVGGDGYADGYGDGYVDVAARTGRYAIVKTDISPEEAQVFLDGKYIGTADDFDGMPDVLYLGPGKYHLEFRLPNYQSFATDLDVARGQQVHLDQKLKLESGKSALDQFPPASKGTPLGRVFTKGPDGTGEAAPPPAPRHSNRRDDGWSDRDTPPPDERVSEEYMDVRPEPLPRPARNRARMRFKVTPEDAAVYVDDRYLGAGEDLAANPRGVVTDPGTHTITVARPGYKTKTVDVTVRVGAPVDVVVELEK